MKKTIVRVIAAAVIAVMLVSALPAFAAAINGTVAQSTAMYEKAKTNSDVVANISGAVIVHSQNSDGTMYQVSITKDGKTYTGWVPSSAVSNLRYASGSGASDAVVSGSSSSGSNPGYSGSDTVSAPAGAFTGTIADSTAMYEKARTSSDKIANIKGTVAIHFQNSDGTMYQVSIIKDGKTYTGWVLKSAVSNVGASGSSGSSGSSSSSGSSGSGSTSTAPAGTYTAVIANSTNLHGSKTYSIKGPVTVYNRDSSGSRIYVSIASDGKTYTGWVDASAISNLRRNGSSIQISELPTDSTASAAGTGYTPYSQAKTGTSRDSVIYMRKTASKSTSSSNVERKVTNARGSQFRILGVDSTGSWLYVEYGGSRGFVRAQDFSVTDGAPSAVTGGSTAQRSDFDKPKVGISTDSVIVMRVNPDKSTDSSNKVVTVKSARGQRFSLIGESGDWYYAQYQSYKGFVRKQDFTISDDTASGSGAVTNSTSTSGVNAGVGTGNSSIERWGSITIPGADTYPVYGNYTNKSGNMYYYSQENLGKSGLNYIHTTTAKGSQIAVMMGHNRRTSRTYFHNLHHIQNAILGKSSCEKCGRSCSGYGRTINANWDGYSTWDVVAFYEVPRGTSSSVLGFNAKPWASSTESYLNYQRNNATSANKGWCDSSALTANGKYIMLITCGDETDSSNTAKLYMLLKARG